MAMIKCKECGAEISDKARACPTCGAEIKKRVGMFLYLPLFLFFAALPSVIFSFFGAGLSLHNGDSIEVSYTVGYLSYSFLPIICALAIPTKNESVKYGILIIYLAIPFVLHYTGTLDKLI